MTGMNKELSADERENFMHSLLAFAKEHKAAHWAGTLDEFLDKLLPADPQGIVARRMAVESISVVQNGGLTTSVESGVGLSAFKLLGPATIPTSSLASK
jgi:hypothetical protein